MRFNKKHLIGMALAFVAAPLAAQQRVPFRGDTPSGRRACRCCRRRRCLCVSRRRRGKNIEVVTLLRDLKTALELGFRRAATRC